MTEQSRPAEAGQKKADTGPVPDRPVSHPPGPQPRPDQPVESASAAPGERRSVSRLLGRASESGDPEVHQALADLQTARMNRAAAEDAPSEDPEARQQEKDALARLRDLGYEE